MFKRTDEHQHTYQRLPMSAGLVRLICTDCSQVGVGLDEKAEELDLTDDDAESILAALSAV